MSTLKEHCEDCKKELGKSFEEVHAYLDQWMGKFGGRHRFLFHHKEGVEEIRLKFGDEAAQAGGR